MIHGTNVLLNQNILGYKVGNKVHFEWNFRWCLGLPKHIETPTIFRNIILHECSLNMAYQWDIHGVSAYLISRFSRSVQLRIPATVYRLIPNQVWVGCFFYQMVLPTYI